MAISKSDEGCLNCGHNLRLQDTIILQKINAHVYSLIFFNRENVLFMFY